MQKDMVKRFVGAGLCAVLMITSGCSAFRTSVSNVDVGDQRHYDQNYDHTDLRTLSDDITAQLLGSPFLIDQPQPPVMMISTIANNTDEHIDTKSLTDQMRVKLLQSGQVRFINESRRKQIMDEQGYQAANVTPGQNASIGEQLGATYMVTGSFAKLPRKAANRYACRSSISAITS